MAGMFCPGVSEIGDRDLGLLFGASGIDPRAPSCAAELGDLMLTSKANYEKNRDGWCADARRLLSEHPKTVGLVEAKRDCSEIDKVSGLLDTIDRRCTLYRITKNGEAALRMKSLNPRCHAKRVEANEAAIASLTDAAGSDPEKGAKTWCDSVFGDHKTQMDALGLNLWFEPK